MPEIPIDVLRGKRRRREYRFVRSDYQNRDLDWSREGAVDVDPGFAPYMARVLERGAETCRREHNQPCHCGAQERTRTDERRLLVLHQVP